MNDPRSLPSQFPVDPAEAEASMLKTDILSFIAGPSVLSESADYAAEVKSRLESATTETVVNRTINILLEVRMNGFLGALATALRAHDDTGLEDELNALYQRVIDQAEGFMHESCASHEAEVHRLLSRYADTATLDEEAFLAIAARCHAWIISLS